MLLWVIGIATLHAGPIELTLPVDCEYGKECFIQNYVDTDPSAGYRDYQCGFLSYNDHKGTDFRLPNLSAMKAGVNVLAAAPGRVRATRNHMPDINVRIIGKEKIKGREAGNAVVIDHGNGWETQYSHLRRGSVRVQKGDIVEAGTVLGVIGLSGQTEFPHLHLAVRYQGETIDPFTGLPPGSGCDKEKGSLWNEQIKEQLAYARSGILNIGFTDTAPAARPFFEHVDSKTTLPNDADQIIFWIHAYGLQKNDIQHMSIIGPNGKVLGNKRIKMKQNQAVRFTLMGVKRRSKPSWPAGEYTGIYRLMRSNTNTATDTIIEKKIPLQVTAQ